MLVTLVIILLLIWAAVVWSIYSNFLVFYSNFSESENYHRAYYTSISALERWELVVKQRSPWYVWSGWFILWIWTWSTYNSDWWSDNDLTWFSYLWDNPSISTVFWTVESKTNRIPAISGWNVEWMLSTWDSVNYNMMDYEDAENFLLYIDNSGGKPYEKVDCDNDWDDNYCNQSTPGRITWEIRLPKLLRERGFGNLNISRALVWQDKWSNVPKDDPIVDWQIRWNYNDNGTVPFTVFSTSKTNTGGRTDAVDYNRDSVFREKYINENLIFSFKSNKQPIDSVTDQLPSLTVVSQKADNISKKKFDDIFKNDTNFSNVKLRFSLLNLLKAYTGAGLNEPHVYPFLEYYVDFNGSEVPDRYYTITAEWNYGDYQVNTIIQKPTTKETILWSFTSIF